MFVVLALSALSFSSRAEESGNVVEVVRESEVRKSPESSSESFGRLPEGTLLRLKGERKGAFERVFVELVDGNIEGWVLRSDLDLAKQEQQQEALDRIASEAPPRHEKKLEPPPSRIRLRTKTRVPKDEVLLLRRETQYFGGFLMDGQLSLIADAPGDFFMGPGFRVGGYLGMPINPIVTGRLEVSYAFHSGVADSFSPGGAGFPVDFGFVDIRAVVDVSLQPVWIFGFLGGIIGISTSTVPAGVVFGPPTDLSNLFLGAGARWMFPLSEFSDFGLTTSYGISALPSPMFIQAFSVGIVLQLKG